MRVGNGTCWPNHAVRTGIGSSLVSPPLRRIVKRTARSLGDEEDEDSDKWIIERWEELLSEEEEVVAGF